MKRLFFIIVILLSFGLNCNAQSKNKKNQKQKSKTTTTYTTTSKTIELHRLSKWDDKIMKSDDLAAYMRDLQTDTILQIERLSAFFFHQLINEYRIKNKKKWLLWNEELWIAARNHCVYLLHMGDLAHEQTKEKKYFTAIEPSERYLFVSSSKGSYKAYGENCLLNHHQYYDIVQISKSIAERSFRQWQNSPGHNATMLSPLFGSQGTAFMINSYLTNYGTSNFANFYENIENEIEITWNENIKQENIPLLKMVNNNVMSTIPEKSLKNSLTFIISELLPQNSDNFCPYMKMATDTHLAYLKTSKNNSLQQTSKNKNYYASTSRKRYLKASKYKTYFYLMKYRLYEKSFKIKIDLEHFIDQTTFSHIKKTIEKAMPKSKNVHKWAFSSDFYYTQNQYECVIDVMWSEKK